MTELAKIENAADLMRQCTDVASVCKSIVTKTAMTIAGRKYVKVEGWQSIAAAYGCLLNVSRVTREQGGIVAIGEVKRISDGAIMSSAEGYVGDDEETWGKRDEYAKRGMAQTRAMSRAARSAFAFVVTLMDAGLETTPAEEVPHDGFQDAPQTSPASRQAPTAPKKPSSTVQPTRKASTAEYLASGKEEVDGEILEGFVKNVETIKNKKYDECANPGGKNWQYRYGITMQDDDRTFGTFNTDLAETAQHAIDQQNKVRIRVMAKGKYLNLEAIEELESDIPFGNEETPEPAEIQDDNLNLA